MGHLRVVFQDAVAVAQDAAITNHRCIAATSAQQAVHCNSLGYIAQAGRGLLDISGIEVKYRYARIVRSHLLNKCGDASQSLDTSMNVIRMENNQFLHAYISLLLIFYE